MPNKKGAIGLFSFVFAIVLLIILAIVVQFIGLGDVDIIYSATGEDRLQGCDITLLNILKTEIENKPYDDIADAISMDKKEEVNETINELIKYTYNSDEIKLKEGSCLKTNRCCSQIIPKKNGGISEVMLINETK